MKSTLTCIVIAVASLTVQPHAQAVPAFDNANAARQACWASRGSVGSTACGSASHSESQSSVYHHNVRTIQQAEEDPRQVKSKGWCAAFSSDSATLSCKDVEFAYLSSGCSSGSVGSTCNSAADEQAGDTACENKDGNPVNVLTGNKIQQVVDVALPGAFPLQHQRTYNSVTGTWSVFPSLTIIKENEPLPSSGAVFCRKSVDEVTNHVTFLGCYVGGGSGSDQLALDFTREDGRVIRATIPSTGTGAPMPDASPSVSAGMEESVRVRTEENDMYIGWTFITADDVTETYDTNGRLLTRTDRRGLTHQYIYDASGVLQSVSDDFGRSLSYTLRPDGQVASVSDSDSRRYDYDYDSEDRLVSVTWPDTTSGNASDNPVIQYHYEDTNHPMALTGVTDERGHRFASWAYDEQGRAVSSERASGTERLSIDFSDVADPTDPRVVTTNAFNKSTTYHLDNPLGVLRVKHIEGHASTNCAASSRYQTFDGLGNVSSRTDENGNVTEYEHNARQLETQRREAVGTADERTISTQWHPTLRLPTQITEPDRVITITYDDAGNVLTRTEAPLP